MRSAGRGFASSFFGGAAARAGDCRGGGWGETLLAFAAIPARLTPKPIPRASEKRTICLWTVITHLLDQQVRRREPSNTAFSLLHLASIIPGPALARRSAC